MIWYFSVVSFQNVPTSHPKHVEIILGMGSAIEKRQYYVREDNDSNV